MEQVDSSSNNKEPSEKKKFLLDDINSLFEKIFKRKRKMKHLNEMYEEELKELFDISKEIKAETVVKTQFNSKVMHLMKESQLINARMRFKLNQSRKQFSLILKNMGKNMMRELFLVDKVDSLSKGDFRRYIETKVKNFLGGEYIDFENISHVHLFEKMKKAISCDPLFKFKGEFSIKGNANVNLKKENELSISKSRKSLINDYLIGNNLGRVNTRNKKRSLVSKPMIEIKENSSEEDIEDYLKKGNSNNHEDVNDFSDFIIKDEENNIIENEIQYTQEQVNETYSENIEESPQMKLVNLINTYYLDYYNMERLLPKQELEALATQILKELKLRNENKERINLFQIIEQRLELLAAISNRGEVITSEI